SPTSFLESTTNRMKCSPLPSPSLIGRTTSRPGSLPGARSEAPALISSLAYILSHLAYSLSQPSTWIVNPFFGASLPRFPTQSFTVQDWFALIMLGSMRQVVRVSLVSAAACPIHATSPHVSMSTPAVARSAGLRACPSMLTSWLISFRVLLLAPIPLGLVHFSLELLGQRVALDSEGGFAPLPKPPPRIRCAGKAGARTPVTSHHVCS